MHGKVIAATPADAFGGWLQVINYDTDLPAHYTLSATFNFHDVKLNDQEQAAIRIIWNECVPAHRPGSLNAFAPCSPLACAVAHPAGQRHHRRIRLGLTAAGCAVAARWRLTPRSPRSPMVSGRCPFSIHVMHGPGAADVAADSVQCLS